MDNAKQLRFNSASMRSEAQARQQAADRARSDADQHTQQGNDQQARTDIVNATRLDGEVADFNARADAFEKKAEMQEAEAQQIQSEQDTMQARMNELEEKKIGLIGS